MFSDNLNITVTATEQPADADETPEEPAIVQESISEPAIV